MGWVAIPLAVLGLAALSGGNNTSYEYAGYQECTYAPAAHPYAAQPAAYATQPAPYATTPGYASANNSPYHSYAQQGHYNAAPTYQGSHTMQGNSTYGAYDDATAATSY